MVLIPPRRATNKSWEQIANLRDSIDSHGKKHHRKLEEYSKVFWKEVLFLNCFDTFFDQTSELASGTASLKGFWDEYDYVLQHIERWKGLVSVDLPESEVTINHARQHVSQLSGYSTASPANY
jgi:hypothetical protein